MHTMARKTPSLWLAVFAVYSFWVSLAQAVSSGQEGKAGEGRGYNVGEPIPVSCLNRNV